MTNSLEQNEQHEKTAPAQRGRRFRYGDLGIAVFVAGVGAFLLVQTARMGTSSSAAFLGPRFFPVVVGVVMIVIGALLAGQAIRGSLGGASDDGAAEVPRESSTDWKSLGIVAATLVLHLLLLNLLGWLLAGALLFWGVSYGLGGRRVLRDLAISLVISSAVQVAFSAGLGLSLPSGILVGVL
ncbi:tripartite tricarboxylate transporter TctB family protein [Parasphingorhabdus pacifica]